jgi:hypothetical protein
MAVDEIVYAFRKDIEPDVALTNFCPPEDGFVWSTHTWSELRFDIATPQKKHESRSGGVCLDISMDIDVFKAPPDLAGQDVFFYVNGIRLGSRFITRRVTVMLELPATLIKSHDNVITIDTPHAARPAEHGLSDTRRLGIQLFSVRLAGG